MLFMVLYNSLYNKTEFREENKLMLFSSFGTPSSFSQREALAACVEAIKAHDVKLWLWDYRYAGVVRLTDQAWMIKGWCPLFMPLTLQLEKMAKVGDLGVFGCSCP